MSRHGSPTRVEGNNPAGSSKMQGLPTGIVLDTLERRFLDASTQQDQLSKSRKDLLVKRERVQISRKQVRAKRIEVGDAEVELMNELRAFVNQSGDLPSSLLDSYRLVETARNNFGELEDDLLQAECTLGGYEWAFMEEEDGLYQFDLPELFDHVKQVLQVLAQPSTLQQPPPPPPPPPPAFPRPGLSTGSMRLSPYYPNVDSRPHPPPPPPPLPPLPLPPLPPPPTPLLLQASNDFAHPVAFNHLPLLLPATTKRQLAVQLDTVDLDGLGQQFNPVREDRLPSRSTIERDFADKTATGAGLEETVDVSAQVTGDIPRIILDTDQNFVDKHDDDGRGEVGGASAYRRHSAPDEPSSFESPGAVPMKRASSDSAMSRPSMQISSKQKVLEWLLNNFIGSGLQKAIYKNILKRYGIDSPLDETLEDRATYYWIVDSGSERQVSGTVTPGTSHAQEFIADSRSWTRGSTQEPLSERPTNFRGGFSHAPAQFLQDPDVVPLPVSPLSSLPTDLSSDSDFSADNHASKPIEMTRTALDYAPTLSVPVQSTNMDSAPGASFEKVNKSVPDDENCEGTGIMAASPCSNYTQIHIKNDIDDDFQNGWDLNVTQAPKDYETSTQSDPVYTENNQDPYETSPKTVPRLPDDSMGLIPPLRIPDRSIDCDPWAIPLPPSPNLSPAVLCAQGEVFCGSPGSDLEISADAPKDIPPIKIEESLDVGSLTTMAMASEAITQSPKHLSSHLRFYHVQVGNTPKRTKSEYSTTRRHHRRFSDFVRHTSKGRSRSTSFISRSREDLCVWIPTTSKD